MKLGYFRLGEECVAFWESASGDNRIDTNHSTGRKYVLGWRSDYDKRIGKPVVMVDADDNDEMGRLASDPGLVSVSQDEWIEFQRRGVWA